MILPRRDLLNLCAAATAAINAPHAASADQTLLPQPGDALVADADPNRTPLLASAIARGAAPTLAWPMNSATGFVRKATRLNQLLLLRAAGNDGEPDQLVAFSAICTHAGCLVSQWIAQTARLRCPCHGSEFDPAKDGNVVVGPAPQPLPMLPIRVADGLITVSGAFSAPPGGHASRTM